MQKIPTKTRALRERFAIASPRPGLLEWLATPVELAGRWIDVLLLEKRNWTSLPMRQRFRAWRWGFSSFSWRLYELDRNDPRDYLDDRKVRLLEHLPNGRYNEALFSKWAFSQILAAIGAQQPEVLGLVRAGRFHSCASEGSTGPAAAGLESLLKSGHKLVVRPSFGGGGTGIMFLEQSSGQTRVNGLLSEPDEWVQLAGDLDDHVVTAFVQQAGYARSIYPGSTNTLRILTLWDSESDRPFVAAACHRFGRAGHGPLDNFHAGAGGISVAIDITSGLLGKGVVRERGALQRVGHHPDTGAAIEGVAVPGWCGVLEELLDLARRLPAARCVGWDLVKRESDWVCLEANPMPGYHVWQVHGGLLKNPRVRQFYRRFGIAK